LAVLIPDYVHLLKNSVADPQVLDVVANLVWLETPVSGFRQKPDVKVLAPLVIQRILVLVRNYKVVDHDAHLPLIARLLHRQDVLVVSFEDVRKRSEVSEAVWRAVMGNLAKALSTTANSFWIDFDHLSFDEGL
jgi:hypothetical protein